MISIQFTIRKLLLFVFLIAISAILLLASENAAAQGPRPGGRNAPTTTLGTGFTYQGQLKNAGALVNGTCTLAFRLYDDVGVGSQIGSPITQTIPITNGLFTTQLNTSNEFGTNAFNGDARWLEIRVSNTCPSGGTFTTLIPREPVSPAPYALTSMYTAYKNVLVVTTSGGHFNSITAALNAIADNSTTNRYLIWVAPGTYTETVTMKPYVDIEGAGELTTRITQVGNITTTTGTVIGASNAELRFLTIENTGGNTDAVAIYNSAASPRLTNVNAVATGASSYNFAVNNQSASPTMLNVTANASGGTDAYGVNNNLSSPIMTNVTAIGSGGSSYNIGLYNASSSLQMKGVTISSTGNGNYSVYNYASSMTIQNSVIGGNGGTLNIGISNLASSGVYTVTINNSQVTGSTYTIFNGSQFTTRVGASLLSGGPVSNTIGTLTCAGVYDEAYVFYASTCP